MPTLPDTADFDASTLFGSVPTVSELPRAASEQAPSLSIFDACHLGVVLRAVLLVQLIMAVVAMFATDTVVDWLVFFAALTGGVLPATLVWLLTACSLKRWLAQLPLPHQWFIGILLGALGGVYACGVWVMTGLIRPAPWYASAAAGALLSAALVAGLMWRSKARTPTAITARLAELQARIRPHFLFNTLNSAIALVRQEPAKAEAMLEDLSELFRHALLESSDSVTLGQEITLAQRYLAIEEIRFGNRLRVQWELDPQAAKAKLPPLLLQPLVENAVKHGVEPNAAGAHVKISTARRNNRVVVKISNTAPAGAGKRGHGLALLNVRERLSLLHDVQAQFQSGLKDGVFQVRLEIPL